MTVPDDAAAAGPGNGKRGLLARIWTSRAGAEVSHGAAPVPASGVVQPSRPPTPRSLVHRSPFGIGFMGTIGALLAVALMTAVGQLQGIVIPIIVSLFLALGLNPAVEWMHRRGLARGLSVLIVALTLIGLIVLGAWAIFPVLSEQITLLVANSPAYLEQLRQNPQIADLDARFQIIARAQEYLQKTDLLTNLFGGLMGAGKAVANLLVSTIVTLVLTLYFLASLPSIKQVVYQLAPASRRDRVRYLANEIFRRIGGYLSGLFIVAASAATAAFLFMSIAGMWAYILALTVVVALFAFIPLVGSTVNMVIVSIVAFSVSPAHGLAALIFFLCYQQFDAYVIQPRVFARSVNVPGALVVIAALAGGTLLGIVGAMLAIPTTAALLLLYREVLVPHLDSR